MPQTIVVLDTISEARADNLRALLPEGFALIHATAHGDEHLKEIVADADFAISGQVAVSGDVFRAARRLKLLHKWGVGVDNIDIEAARACGIKVARTTGSNALPVAEFALGLMLSALRSIVSADRTLRSGIWREAGPPRNAFMLSGKTVGIVGFGAAGQALARILAGFSCRILYTKRTPLPTTEEAALGASFATLDDLLAQADVVSLHCPLTPETANLIDRKRLALMKPTAVLVNVARGGIVVEDDLAWALRERVIHAAATDVFATEPLPPNSPLIAIDNLVATPHLAAGAADNFVPTVRRMFDNMLRVSRGEPVREGDLVV